LEGIGQRRGRKSSEERAKLLRGASRMTGRGKNGALRRNEKHNTRKKTSRIFTNSPGGDLRLRPKSREEKESNVTKGGGLVEEYQHQKIHGKRERKGLEY